MSMQVGSPDGQEDEVLSAINTTPLVDVMLVLLIIFLITIPVVTYNVPLTLPHEINQPSRTNPENITLAVDKNGIIYWNNKAVTGADGLYEQLKTIAVLDPQPEVLVRGDQDARYEFIGKVLANCQRAGIAKVNLITEPPPNG
jgi:biopolymer transport protein ExbD